MALNAWLTLTGETQGAIKGSGDVDPHIEEIEVYGWSHEVVSPRDVASGLPTGKRQHKPLNIVKAIDKSSPLLMMVLTNNENLSDFKLKCYRPSSSGAEEHFYTVELTNANIAGIRMESLNNKYAENMNHEARETVSFTYQKVMWTFEDGGITADDDWKVQRS